MIKIRKRKSGYQARYTTPWGAHIKLTSYQTAADARKAAEKDLDRRLAVGK